MKAIKTNLENKHLLNREVGVIVAFGSLPKFWLQDEIGDGDGFAQGFGDLEVPILLEFQKYGQILETETQVFIYEVIDFTQEEIDAEILIRNSVLRIHDINSNFDTHKDLVSNIAYSMEKNFNEFNGLKESTSYVNNENEIVAVKTFSIYNENGNKGTKLIIDYYNKINEVQESVENRDYYSDLQIKQHTTKCIIRVFERLLWDVKQEIKQLNFILTYYTEEQKLQVLEVLGVPDIATLEQIPIDLEFMFDDLFKGNLSQEVDTLYKTGSSVDLFNRISDPLFYLPLDTQAITSEQEVKYTYRQILQAKFNPINFIFY